MSRVRAFSIAGLSVERSHPSSVAISLRERPRIMGTSAKMIEQHYGTLIDTAHDAILNRLEAAAP